MDVTEAILGRRSIRKFRSDPISPDDIDHLLAAAFAGPIGTQRECRYFVVLAGEDKKALVEEVLQPGLVRLAESLEDCAARETVRYTRALLSPLRSAPVVIAAYMELIDRDESLALPTVSAAVENLLLAAHDRGLATCWITGANYLAEDISEHLEIRRKQLVALVPVGRPAEQPAPRTRPVRAERREMPEGPDAGEREPEPAVVPIPEWVDKVEAPAPEILIADDRVSVRARIGEILTKAGYSVREAESWEDVLDAVNEQPPALVILDAFLPGTCIGDVAQQLGQGVATYVPVLVTASAYHLEDKAQALAMGADGFLAKPVRWPELLGQVRSLLRTKQLYDELAQARDDLERIMHHRQRLTDMIVHDLRSPLGGIIGTMEYVLEDQDSTLEESARELLDMSLASGRNLLGMVNDLLDISKMSEVGLPLKLAPVAVGEVAQAALGQVARLATEKQIELGSEVPPDLPLVTADREKLQRVLVNLLGNAIKFTPAGGNVDLSVVVDGDGATISLAVRDTGVGIPESEHERIFELFTQVEREGPDQPKGTGLGLAFCKMVVESHGGSIGVDSEQGKGSVFTVRLPVSGPARPA